MPISEFVTFTATDEYLANPAAASTLGIELMVKQPGLVGPVYYAVEDEDKKTAYMFIAWESIQHHMDLANSPDYGLIMAEFGKVTKEAHRWQHVQFKEPPNAALSAPVTEIAVLKLKEGKTEEVFFKVFDQLVENLNKGSTIHGLTWGNSVENQNTYVLLIGWDSVQAHIDAVKDAPFDSIIPALYDIADITLKHAAFSAYKKT